MVEKAGKTAADRERIFADMPVGRALYVMAAPTVISQLINLIYNMVDAFYIGRTGDPYKMAATTVTISLMMLNVAMANLFGIGGGSLMARLMGLGRKDEAKAVSAFAVYATVIAAAAYSLGVGLFREPLLRFLGASDRTIGYASSYATIVIVIGVIPSMLSQVLAHLLRNVGCSKEASLGLSGGGILNIILDPLFMFVILPKGMEVTGAAVATAISNACACVYLLTVYRRREQTAPLSLRPADARAASPENRRSVFTVGIPSALQLALFDLANICANKLAAAHSDLVLAGLGIVMKIERIPNAVNIGICQGMMPIVAYNYSSGNHARMRETMRKARLFGLLISGSCVVLLEIFARPASQLFLSISAGDAEAAVATLGFAALFLRIRALASPGQFLCYSSSFSMQAIGSGSAPLVLACVRELALYIPLMFLLDGLFGEIGLASALPAGEWLTAVFAVILLRRVMKKKGISGKEDR